MIKKRIVKIIIAVAISYLKTNSYEHDDISIDVKNIDSQDDSMIQIDVSRNGSLEKSEAFNLREQVQMRILKLMSF